MNDWPSTTLRKMLEQRVDTLFYFLVSKNLTGKKLDKKMGEARKSISQYTDEELLSVYDCLKKESGI